MNDKKEMVKEIMKECRNKNVPYNQEELENSTDVEIFVIYQLMQAIKNSTKYELQQIIQLMKNTWFPN